MPRITKIPASISRYTSAPIDAPVKRKVAAYARVSTDNEEQLTSYAAQISYYTDYIKGREDWEFVKVYTDEESPAARPNAERASSRWSLMPLRER